MASSVKMQEVFANAEEALENVAEQSQNDAVALLAEKFNFNVTEAKNYLNQSGAAKSTKNTSRSAGKGKKNKSGKEKLCDVDPVVHTKSKRNPSGYMLYSSHVRPSVTNDLTEKLGDGEKLRGPEVMKGIAVRWKGLADSERNSWTTKAKTTTMQEDGETP